VVAHSAADHFSLLQTHPTHIVLGSQDLLFGVKPFRPFPELPPILTKEGNHLLQIPLIVIVQIQADVTTVNEEHTLDFLKLVDDVSE
jgi:hypothetical protein